MADILCFSKSKSWLLKFAFVNDSYNAMWRALTLYSNLGMQSLMAPFHPIAMDNHNAHNVHNYTTTIQVAIQWIQVWPSAHTFVNGFVTLPWTKCGATTACDITIKVILSISPCTGQCAMVVHDNDNPLIQPKCGL